MLEWISGSTQINPQNSPVRCDAYNDIQKTTCPFGRTAREAGPKNALIVETGLLWLIQHRSLYTGPSELTASCRSYLRNNECSPFLGFADVKLRFGRASYSR